MAQTTLGLYKFQNLDLILAWMNETKWEAVKFGYNMRIFEWLQTLHSITVMKIIWSTTNNTITRKLYLYSSLNNTLFL